MRMPTSDFHSKIHALLHRPTDAPRALEGMNYNRISANIRLLTGGSQ